MRKSRLDYDPTEVSGSGYWRWPAAVFLSGIFLTGTLAWFARESAHARDVGRFENAVQRSGPAIEARLDLYIGLLRAGAGLFAAEEGVNREIFEAFVERIDLPRHYPGVQGIGFAQRVRREELPGLVAAVRNAGRPSFDVSPVGERAEYFPIVFLEPLDRRNEEAIGFDMFSEPTRNAAMARARDQAHPVASGRVVLVQEIDVEKQAGFLIYLPVYRGRQIPATEAERRDLLHGFIYSPFRAGDFLAGVLGNQTTPRLRFEVFDGPDAAPERLLYASPVEVLKHPQFSQATRLQVADRTWTVVYQTTPAFEAASARVWTPWVLIGGLMVSGMLGAITLALARTAMRSRLRGRELEAQGEQLRERERLLRAAASGARVSLMIVNRNYEYLFANEAFCNVVGWSKEQIMGRRVPDVLPAAWPQIQPQLDRALSGERLSYELAIPPRPGGSERERWFTAIYEPQGEAGERTVVIVYVDITERRRGEEALRASEARKDAILRTALDAIITIDHESRLVEFNPAAEEIFGYKRDAIIGQSMAELIIPPRYRERHYRGLKHYLATGEGPVLRQRIELSAMRADGAEFPAELAILPIPGSEPPMFTAFLRDITERKRAEQQLRDAAERFRFMAESMPQKIFTARPDGEFDYFNEQWMQFTGLTAEELQQGKWERFVHPDDLAKNYRRWTHAVACAEPVQVEHRIRRHDGVYRWHLTRAHAMRDAAGKVMMWIGSNTDIEDQKRHEAQLENTVAERTADLREINEQLEAFVYTIAHDLRGPLRSINGFSHILAEDHSTALSEDGKHLVQRIRGSAEFMDRLILDLLAFGRTARADIELSGVDVRKAWEIAVAQTSAQRDQAQAEIETMGPFPLVRAHEATLGQVLANLLGNAMKFVAPGVRPHIRFRSEDRGAVARLWVEDNGIGIPAEMQERIFRVFERLHGSRYAGTGIGLSIVRKGVERMGGRVGIESDLGKGTRFWIELPKAES